MAAGDVANIASTGTRARSVVHVGHFYGAGGRAGGDALFPQATAVLDIGVNSDAVFSTGRSLPQARSRRAAPVSCDSGEMLEQLARRSGPTLDELSLVPERSGSTTIWSSGRAC